MFDYLRRERDKIHQTSSTTALKTGQVAPVEKRCPNCGAVFPLNYVTCEFDLTLLTLKKDMRPEFLPSIIAVRSDGTKWTLLPQGYFGSGSICDVYEAFDTSSGEKFAVKALMLKVMNDSKSEHKYLEGAKKSLSLQHENIVASFAVGSTQNQKGKSSRPFTVCEILKGTQLSRLLDKDNLPSIAETLTVASHICGALEYAHGQGVIHGDLKPSNIFIEFGKDKDMAKVCDFAVAERLFQGLEWNQVTTMTGSIYGSAVYLAPDYAESRTPTVASDIYSLGCIMYECMAGHPPFMGNNDFHTIMQHMKEAPKPLDGKYELNGVADIVRRALEKEPGKRFQSAKEMGLAINASLNQLR